MRNVQVGPSDIHRQTPDMSQTGQNCFADRHRRTGVEGHL